MGFYNYTVGDILYCHQWTLASSLEVSLQYVYSEKFIVKGNTSNRIYIKSKYQNRYGRHGHSGEIVLALIFFSSLAPNGLFLNVHVKTACILDKHLINWKLCYKYNTYH